MILGTLGLICFAASVVGVYFQYGTIPGIIAAFLVGGLSLVGFVIWLSLFPHTFIGRHLMLRTSQPTDPKVLEHFSLVGKSGVALSPLRPAGTAQIGGKRLDVTTLGEFLGSGRPVEVVAADGMRVIVREKDKLVTGPEVA